MSIKLKASLPALPEGMAWDFPVSASGKIMARIVNAKHNVGVVVAEGWGATLYEAMMGALAKMEEDEKERHAAMMAWIENGGNIGV